MLCLGCCSIFGDTAEEALRHAREAVGFPTPGDAIDRYEQAIVNQLVAGARRRVANLKPGTVTFRAKSHFV